MVTDGAAPTFGLWYDFRQKPPPGDYARFYAECFEVAPRVRDAAGT